MQCTISHTLHAASLDKLMYYSSCYAACRHGSSTSPHAAPTEHDDRASLNSDLPRTDLQPLTSHSHKPPATTQEQSTPLCSSSLAASSGSSHGLTSTALRHHESALSSSQATTSPQQAMLTSSPSTLTTAALPQPRVGPASNLWPLHVLKSSQLDAARLDTELIAMLREQFMSIFSLFQPVSV